MKKIILFALLFSGIAIQASAQEEYIGNELKALLRKEGYSISTERYAELSEGESAQQVKTFYAGTDYAVVAYSEESGVLDVDVYLYDSDGSLLVKDTETDVFAIVDYSPYVTRDMKVVVKNYDSSSSYSEYDIKIIIAYSN